MKIFKFFLALLYFVVSQNSFAQDPLLFEGTWELYSLEIDGEQFLPPSNGEVGSIELIFEEADENNPHFFDTYVCNSFMGDVTFVDEGNGVNSSFSVGEYSMTLVFCDLSENEIFENQYFNFYLNSIEDPFEYSIVFLGDAVTLHVVASNGDLAEYGNTLLSASDFVQPSFSIYPNPAQNQIFIDADQAIETYMITVFDMQGKQKLRTSKKMLDTNSLDIQNWASGVYFVRFENQNGAITTQRFIKK